MGSSGFEEGMRRTVLGLLDSILEGKESVTYREIDEKDLPQFIKNSFQALARKQVKEHTSISLRPQGHTTFDDQDLKKARENFIAEMQKGVLFSRSEVESCIRNTLKIRFELLLRPKKAIESFFFRRNEELDKNLLVLSLERFGESVPFLRQLCKELVGYKSDRIKSTTFSALANRVRQELYSNGHQDTIVKDSKLLIDFFNIDGAWEANGIESHLVEEFFVTRGYEEASKIVREKTSAGKRLWSKEDILSLLKEVVASSSLETALEMKPKNGLHPRIIYSDDLEEKIQREKIERQPPGPYPSILSFIKQDDWDMLLKKIFKKDSLAMSRFVQKIDRLEKWREAKEIIDWELEQRNVDHFSKEAVRLGDLVFAKFFLNGKYS